MYAIVLTHQKRHPFAQLVLSSYDEFWPDNHFIFRVAFNTDPPQFTTKQNVEDVKTDIAIKSTMSALLEGVDDHSFVYWCTDDRYIARVFDGQSLSTLHSYILSDETKPFDALRLMTHTHYKAHTPTNIRIPQSQCVIQYHQAALARGFWHHHFIRAGVLRAIFVDVEMQNYIIHHPTQELLRGRFSHRVYSPTDNILQFGEPTIEDAITQNCVDAFRKYQLTMPEGYKKSGVYQFFPDNVKPLTRLSRWVSQALGWTERQSR